jgi:hypothetical protein
MDWMNAVNDIVQRYSGQGGGATAAPANPHNDFRQVAQTAPPEVVASGLSQAFRSEQSPPFPEMLANLFGHSDPYQRADVLNRLLGAAGPGVVAALPNLGGLSHLLGRDAVTPQQANQVTPGQVTQIAAAAERQNPSVVDEISSFYAQHPDVVKALGGLAITIALQHMLRR